MKTSKLIEVDPVNKIVKLNNGVVTVVCHESETLDDCIRRALKWLPVALEYGD